MKKAKTKALIHARGRTPGMNERLCSLQSIIAQENAFVNRFCNFFAVKLQDSRFCAAVELHDLADDVGVRKIAVVQDARFAHHAEIFDGQGGDFAFLQLV